MISEKEFEDAKAKALDKWNKGINEPDWREWFSIIGKRKCSFCHAFLYCSSCPLDDKLNDYACSREFIACIEAWEEDDEEDFRENAKLLYHRISELTYKDLPEPTEEEEESSDEIRKLYNRISALTYEELPDRPEEGENA